MAMAAVRNVHDYNGNIQTAINSLPASGGEVYIPAGSYIISSAITLNDNILLRGAGRSTILTLTNNASANTNVISVTSKNNIHIKDLCIDGNKANNINANLYGIKYDIVNNGRIENCYLTNVKDVGIQIARSSGVTIFNNHIFDNGSNAGILMQNGTVHSTITNNVLGRMGAPFGNAIFVDGTTAGVSDIIVANNQCFDYYDVGIEVGGTDQTNNNVIIANNVCTSGLCGILVRRTNNAIVKNNIVRNAFSSHGISVYGDSIEATNIVIEGNQVHMGSGPNIKCIDGNGGSDMIIANNVCISGGGVRIQASASNRIKVDNNIIKRSSIHGLVISNTDETIVTKNLITDNDGIGINLTHSSTINNAVISDNIVARNKLDGIQLYNLSNYIVNGNLIFNNGSAGYVRDGLILSVCNKGIITGNKVYDTQSPKLQTNGIKESGASDYNLFNGNSCMGNSGLGISLIANNNSIIVNNFTSGT